MTSSTEHDGTAGSGNRRPRRWTGRRRVRDLDRAKVAVPWREAEYCVLDFETTGLDLRSDDIVSFGCVPVREGRVIVAERDYGLVRPRRPPSVASITVHALAGRDLVDAMSIEDCADRLARHLDRRILVAHAAWIEQPLLTRALGTRGLRFRGPVVDTASLARAAGLHGERAGVEPSLEALATGLALPVHTPHHALGDAVTTAQVFIVLAAKLTAAAPNAKDLVRLTSRDRGA